MKKIYFLLIIFCISTTFSIAQTTSTKNSYLPTSRTKSEYALVYKLKDSKKVFKNKDIGEFLANHSDEKNDFMTLVDSVKLKEGKSEADFPQNLDYGYYLTVWVDEDVVKTRLTTIAPLNVVLQSNAKRSWLIVYDSLGNELSNLKIKADHSHLSYSKKLKSYGLPNHKKKAYIEVEYAGETWYLFAQRETNSYRYKRPFIKRVVYGFPIKYFWIVPYREVKRVVEAIRYGDLEYLGVVRFFVDLFTKDDDDDYYYNHASFNGQPAAGKNGYLVTDKLKYRPLDTLRFKTYLTNKKGKPIQDDEINVYITTDRQNYKKIETLKAYRKGGFESEFVLADSLKLKLGNFVGLVLENKKGETLISTSIHYQDYVLPEIKSFDIEPSDKRHIRNTPFSLRITAKDFNNLNVLDGKIKLEAKITGLSTTYEPSVSRTLNWKHEQNLEPFGETIITIPDSIFPAADLLYEIKAILHNSNNERLENAVSIPYDHFTKKPTLEAHFEDGFVVATYREGKDTVLKKAVVYKYFTDNFEKQSGKIDTIELPFREKVNAIYSRVSFLVDLETEEDYHYLTKDVAVPSSFEVAGYYQPDSLIMTIQNPFRSVVRYSLFCKNNLIEKKADSSSFIRIAIKDRHKKVYVLQTTHTFAGQTKDTKDIFLRNRKQIFIDVDAPLMTSPSFKEKINLTVTDYKNRPVKNADVTVVATNGKFKDFTRVNIQNTQRTRFRFKNKKKINRIELRAQGIREKYLRHYPYWQERFGLDSMAFYNFLLPKKEGFRVSIPYQRLRDSLISTLENINAFSDRAEHLIRNFDTDHREDKGALSLFFFDKDGYEGILWIKVDDSLAYLHNAAVYDNFLLTLSEGKHKIEVRTEYHNIVIDSLSIPKKAETILSFDIENLPNYIKKQTATPIFTEQEKMMLASHSFVAFTYGSKSLNENMGVQQGDGRIKIIYPKYRYDKKEKEYRYEWNYPLLQKGEFRVLRHNKRKWDTLYFEPFTAYDFREGKYISRDTTFADGTKTVYYEEKRDIIKRDTLEKSLFFQKAYYNTSHQQKGLITNSHAFPFFNYSSFYNQRNEPYLYKWKTSQVEVVARSWRKLIFKNIDSLSENFEKEYFFENQIRFKGKLPNGTYKVSIYYQKYSYEGDYYRCQRVDSVKIEEGKFMTLNFEEVTTDCEGQRVEWQKTNLEKTERAEKIDRTTLLYDDYDFANGKLYIGRVTCPDGALPGATVQIKGTTRGTTTDMEGNYSIIAPIGSTLIFRFVGFSTVEKTTTPYTNLVDVVLDESSSLSEVVVAGYGGGRVKKAKSYAVATVANDLQGTAAGVNGGGKRSKSLLDLSNTLSFESEGLDLGDTEIENKKKSIRNYFTDNAIWQPTLRTDKKGKASFEVTYPDDITSWKTLAVAYGKKNQNGQALTQTNSFLTLSAQLSLPRFLVEGDSVRIIGKVASYSSDSVNLKTYFDIDGQNFSKEKRNVLFSSIDSLRFSVPDNSNRKQDLSIDSLNNLQDSLKIQYVMKADISDKQVYTDGEERKIPIFKKGLTRRQGFFAILEGDTTLDLRAFKDSISSQNPVKLYVKDNILEAMVSELEHIQNYAYACNEQKASKIRAYMLEKDIKTRLGLPFEKKKQKELENLITKLVEAQYNDGWWGWWATSAPNAHMTAYIYGVLYDAQEKGYSIPNETLEKAEQVLIKDLELRDWNAQAEIYTVLSKNKKYIPIYKDSVAKLAVTMQIREYPSFYNQLSVLRIKQLYDLPISLRLLEIKQKRTQFGAIFWQEYDYRGYYSLFTNNLQSNLLAYQILRDVQKKSKNSHNIDLAKVRQYFLERRNQNGYWRSTHESASILSTILPDFESKSKNKSKVELQADGNNLLTEKEYIFSEETLPNELVKKGIAPVFVSATQEYFTPQVTQKTSDNFHIKTYFKDPKTGYRTEVKADSVFVTAGKPIVLMVEVTARAESEYVSIEIPIPASCVYGKNPYSFRQNYFYYYRGIETYREEFKHKTAIFCTQIPIGTHTFEIVLEPRYSGVFTLNPASVELMYFPNIAGNESTKKVFVE